jgi:hypothetical protein
VLLPRGAAPDAASGVRDSLLPPERCCDASGRLAHAKCR